MPDDVRLAVAGRIARIVIDRPATRNAIDRGVMATLGRLLDELDERIGSGDVGVVAIRGGGDRAFISGGDLKELAQIRTETEAAAMSLTMRGVLDRVATLPVPTVALVNGDAYGGGAEVAVACDIRLAADGSRIAFNQVALGVMPAWGGIERLVTLVGRGRALHLLLTGAVLDTRAAAQAGLVEQVASREQFDAQADALLARLAAVPATPARAIKSLVGSAAPASWPQLADVACAEFARSWVADDHWQAVSAAQEQRRARKACGRSGDHGGQ